jgi:Ca2+-binding EF-hand superfamily protein
MFEKADADGDGKISADEFAASAPGKFEKLDQNDDGLITPDEVQGHGKGDCENDKA